MIGAICALALGQAVGGPQALDTLKSTLFDGLLAQHSPQRANSSSRELAETITQDLRQGKVLEAQILSYADGDTVHLQFAGDATDIKCRLIGIDTPEKKSQPDLAQAATTHLQELTSAKTVWVSSDQELFDKYGRLLIYLWTSEPRNTGDLDLLINYHMVNDGFAEALAVKPNTAHRKELEAAERSAVQGNRGLWEQGDFSKRQRYS